MSETPEFNFKEQRMEFKQPSKGNEQLETKVDKIRVFKMV